jgi:hypothetical protein
MPSFDVNHIFDCEYRISHKNKSNRVSVSREEVLLRLGDYSGRQKRT